VILIILKFFVNCTKWIDELDAKVNVEVDNLHVKRNDSEDLVGYAYIIRVD
jgi:type II secretory pathway component PulM